MLNRSAVILAGGSSSRFGRDKGLVVLASKPLILHIIDRVFGAVDEVLVVVSSEKQKIKFETILKDKAKMVIDKYNSRSPLVGALTGFEIAKAKYSLLLPVDTPLVSTKIIQFLLKKSINRNAAIPKWPNGYIEPLQAVYHTETAITAARTVLEQGKKNMQSMIDAIRDVCYVSTIILEQLEPPLLTFLNINTINDLKKAEFILQ